MERKKLFYSVILPIGVAMGLSGCNTTTPDVADYLKLQCDGDPKMETAHQSVELVPGQMIDIGSRDFKVTEKGRLRYLGNDPSAIETGQRDFIVIGYANYGGQRYVVSLERPEIGNKTIVNVSLNCKNPQELN